MFNVDRAVRQLWKRLASIAVKRLPPNRYPPFISDLKLTCLRNPFSDF